MTVVVCIAGKGNIKAFSHVDEALHGIFGRRVHADLAIPVQQHESKARVDHVAEDGQIKLVAPCNGSPVMHTCATHRVNTHPDLCIADGIHVNHVAKVAYIGVHEIVAVRGGGQQRPGVRHALDTRQPGDQQPVGFGLNPPGDVLSGRTAVGWVVLQAPIARRVVRGGHDDAVRQTP